MTAALSQQRILITGSSRGIGAAVARLARSQGADVILHGKSASDALRTNAEELDAPFIVCDTTRNAVEEAVISVTAKQGSITALVNSAGGHVNPKPFLELTDDDWH